MQGDRSAIINDSARWRRKKSRARVAVSHVVYNVNDPRFPKRMSRDNNSRYKLSDDNETYKNDA